MLNGLNSLLELLELSFFLARMGKSVCDRFTSGHLTIISILFVLEGTSFYDARFVTMSMSLVSSTLVGPRSTDDKTRS